MTRAQLAQLYWRAEARRRRRERIEIAFTSLLLAAGVAAFVIMCWLWWARGER